MKSNKIIIPLLLLVIAGAVIMGIFKKKPKAYYYTEAEMDAVEAYIDSTFGKSDEVFHELLSPDIHVDIAIIPPSEERNYYTLVTMGMGARPMDVPKKFREYNTGRAEIMVTLPPDWKIKSDGEEDYWPIRWLKILARLPIEHDTWLGWGHTIPNGEPFAENTELSGVILQAPYLSEDAYRCELPGGSIVEFYHMIPLYEEEMQYKIENGSEEMFERFGPDFSHVVDINRKNNLK